MKNLYVIGPVTGIENDNRPAFEAARQRLFAAGYWVVGIPHDHIASGTPWGMAMRISICKMLGHGAGRGFGHIVYDGVAMLPGWEDSKGARIEHDLAAELGIPCKTVDEWIEEARNGRA